MSAGRPLEQEERAGPAYKLCEFFLHNALLIIARFTSVFFTIPQDGKQETGQLLDSFLTLLMIRMLNSSTPS